MSNNNLPNAAVMTTGDHDELDTSIGFSSLDLSSSTLSSATSASTALLEQAAVFAKLPVSGAVDYDPNQPHPDWGEGYYPNPSANQYGDIFQFAYSSLSFGSKTPLFSALVAAAKNGIPLFGNADDPNSARIIINNPGNGSSLQIGQGLHLSIGGTLSSLLEKNGFDVNDPNIAAYLRRYYPDLWNILKKQGSGRMVVWNKTGVDVAVKDNVNNLASMEVGAGNKLYVGDVNRPQDGYDAFGTGNVRLGYNGGSKVGEAAMILDEGSYLSVNGYLGGTADKADAGTGDYNTLLRARTAAVSTQNNVSMDVEGNWVETGDLSRTVSTNPVFTQVGANNNIFVGGNIGVYLLVSMTVGDNTVVSVGRQGWAHTGSGFFVGSGGYVSTGYNNKYYIAGGMGVAYVNATTGDRSQLLLGNNNSIVMSNGNAGILAAENGGFISAGDNFFARGAEMSLGYAQDAKNRILNTRSAGTGTMSIGNGASISLGYEGLYFNDGESIQAQDGVIVLDGSNSLLKIGEDLDLKAKLLSVGNYYRNSKDPAYQDSNGNYLSQSALGANNSVIIGKGANISLGRGIIIDSTKGYVQLDGGVLNAGFISIGRYYQSGGPVGSSSFFADGSNASMTIGDGYQVNLTNANGQTGNLTIDGSFDALNVGNNVNLHANNFYLGDYRTPDNKSSYVTNNTSVYIGQGTSVTFDGEMRLTGVSNTFTMLDNSFLQAQTMILDQGYAGGNRGNQLNFGNNAIININDTIIDNMNGGSFNLRGAKLTLHKGNFQMGGATTNILNISNGGSLILEDGNLVLTNNAQSAVVNGAGTIVQGNQLIVNGNSQLFSAGTGANVTFNKGIEQNGSRTTIVVDSDATINADYIHINGSVNATNTLTVGSKGHLVVKNDIAFTGVGGYFNIYDDASLTAGLITADLANTNFNIRNNIHFETGGWSLNNTSNARRTITIGNGAYGNFGNLNLLGSNIAFNMGTFGSGGITFGDMNLGVNNSFTAAGAITGRSMSMGNNTSFSASDANFNDGTVTLAGNDSFLLTRVGGTFKAGDVIINGSNNVFSLANNTTFQANSVTADLNTTSSNNVFRLGTGMHYAVGSWNLRNSGPGNKLFTVGDNSDGNFGNLTLSGNVTFGTGSARNLAFGTVSLSTGTIFNATGQISIQTMDMSQGGTLNVNTNLDVGQLNIGNGGKVSVANGSTLNINSLVMDGTLPGSIEVGNNSTLNIGQLSTTNVGSNQIPKIILHDGAHVIVNGQSLTRADIQGKYMVHFEDNSSGIFTYNGDIRDINGHLIIDNFSLNDQLLFNVNVGPSATSSQFSTSYDADTGLLSIIYNGPNGPEILAQFAYNPANSSDPLPNVLFGRGANGQGQITITKCFVAGTHILTSRGEILVESLKVGDEVVTIDQGQRRNRKIVWIGNMDVDVDQYQDKTDLYPVRIKAHAFGLNKPYRDLLVTPEHTIFVDGGLIPARMLVNGRSIIIDETMKNFTVYHVETEQHSILLSENLMTESYLNTDDRHLFDEGVTPLHLSFDEHADHKNWQEDAAAPLMVARNKVEPIWHRLDRRATQLGYKPVAKQITTKDPDLCLVTQKGEKLAPVNIKGNVYSFYVAATTQVVAISSRSALPSEVVGPYLDDRRKLGVLVAKISVIADKTLTVIPSDIPNLPGWHGIESNRTDRWTKGMAQLPNEITGFSKKDKLIKIELTDTASYLVDIDFDQASKSA